MHPSQLDTLTITAANNGGLVFRTTAVAHLIISYMRDGETYNYNLPDARDLLVIIDPASPQTQEPR